MDKYNFDDIRSFRDEEVNQKLRNLVKDKGFIYILKKIFTDERIANLSNELNEVNSVYDFQSKYISYYVESLVNLSISELSVTGIEKLDKNKAYLFISNHRDIILDSALINESLLKNGLATSEIAIGNNLLIYKWIEDLARLNKSFVVKRDLQGKEMLRASMKLSAYIRNTIANRNTSVWIAQKEGRTKDGNDLTDLALLKMLNFSGTNNFIKDFSELNIVPVSISYEYEPTIESKIASTYSKLQGKKYHKTLEDDLEDMGRGLYNIKGRVCISFGECVNSEIQKFNKDTNRNINIQKLSELIDKEIYDNFKLTKNNYIAFDILTNSKKSLREKKYLKEDETKLRFQCKKIINSIKGENDLLENIFYGIYANPLINKIKLP
ncbi:MAG: 1-acyl-sn-glycerol-3-phosphate acyltransferase [Bacteroidales bacterium]|nr:1-acyl-sn-glycerol-3-phosphate acyltransferase [Bacteroidales bacterium]